MNELNTRLLEYLPDPNTVKGGISEVVDKLQDEAPVLVDEVIRWTILCDLKWFCLGLCVLGVFVCCTPRTIRWIKGIKDMNLDDKFILGLFFMVLYYLPSACLLLTTTGWLKPLLAPRLFLLEYVRNLF